MRVLVFLAVVGTGLAWVSDAGAQSRKAWKTLDLIKQVDGAGSGLDADRVQGMTPADIVNQAPSATVNALIAAGYEVFGQTSMSPGFCACVPAAPNDANDPILNCGGELDPFNAAGSLTKVMNVVTATEAYCQACGCNDGVSSITVRARAACINRQ